MRGVVATVGSELNFTSMLFGFYGTFQIKEELILQWYLKTERPTDRLTDRMANTDQIYSIDGKCN